MPQFIISSEDDMERGIEYARELALSYTNGKQMELTFPSKEFMEIFMTNLFIDFYKNDVPINTGIDLILSIPETEDD